MSRGPRLSRVRRRPFDHDGRCGPSDLDEGHRAVAELLVEPAYDGRREQAELGGPGGRVGAHDQLAVREALRGAVRADLRSDQVGPAAKTPRTRSSSSQPWSATSRSTLRAEQLRVPVVGMSARDPGLAAVAASCRRRAVGVEPAVARVSCRARSRPSSCARLVRRSVPSVPLVGRQPSRVTFPSATTNRAPASAVGHVLGHRRGDQHLLGAGNEVGELGPAFAVELGEDVVEDQDRVVAVGAEQVVRRQPQRERERPGLPVGGVPLHR